MISLLFSITASASTLVCEKEPFLAKLSQLKTSGSVKFTVLGARKVPNIELCEYIVRDKDGLTTLYANDSYLVLANLISFTTGESITHDATVPYQTVARSGYNELRAAAGKEVGVGKKEVILLSDPECPYCEKLMANLIGLEDEYTFKYVFFPLMSHAVGQLATYELLCTEDGIKKLAAITNLSELRDLKEGVQERLFADKKQPDAKLCNALTTRLSMTHAVLRKNNIKNPSVPMLIFPDGTWTSGTMKRERFEKLANAHQ